MKLCKTCRALMIGDEAPRSMRRLRRLLRNHGAFLETVDTVALSLGPMCDRCIKNLTAVLECPDFPG